MFPVFTICYQMAFLHLATHSQRTTNILTWLAWQNKDLKKPKHSMKARCFHAWFSGLYLSQTESVTFSGIYCNWHFELMKIRLCWHTCICFDIWLHSIFMDDNFLRLSNCISVRGSFSSQNKTPTFEKFKCKNFMHLTLRHTLEQKRQQRAGGLCRKIGEKDRFVSGQVWNIRMI